jgi:hypothetical protein
LIWARGRKRRKGWKDARFCLRFGLWAAAVFRLVPPMLNEGDALFLSNCGTFDLPYVVLGACLHGGLAALLACPYARRVLDLPEWSGLESQWEMCGAVVLSSLSPPPSSGCWPEPPAAANRPVLRSIAAGGCLPPANTHNLLNQVYWPDVAAIPRSALRLPHFNGCPREQPKTNEFTSRKGAKLSTAPASERHGGLPSGSTHRMTRPAMRTVGQADK